MHIRSRSLYSSYFYPAVYIFSLTVLFDVAVRSCASRSQTLLASPPIGKHPPYLANPSTTTLAFFFHRQNSLLKALAKGGNTLIHETFRRSC